MPSSSGSGPNGLAAAVALARAGLSVTVLEARRRDRRRGPDGGARRSRGCSTTPAPACTRFGGRRRRTCRSLPPRRSTGCAGAGPRSTSPTRSTAVAPAVLPAVGGRHGGGPGAPTAPSWRAAVRSADRAASTRWPTSSSSPLLHVPAPPAAPGPVRARGRCSRPRRWRAAAERREARALFGGVAAHAFRPLERADDGGDRPGADRPPAHAVGWPVAEGGTGPIIRRAWPRCSARTAAPSRPGVTVTVAGRPAGSDASPSSTSRPPRALADHRAATACRPAVRRALPALPPRPGRVQGRPGGRGRGARGPPRRCRRAGTVHLGGTFEEIAAGRARACAPGRMPERPFVLVGQQYLADPTRSVGDVHPLWAYAHVPHGYAGDATDGGPRPDRAVRARASATGSSATAVRDPADLDRRQRQLRGRRHRAPAPTTPCQVVVRPRLALDPYATGVPGIYLCSAATPAGRRGARDVRRATRPARPCGTSAARSTRSDPRHMPTACGAARRPFIGSLWPLVKPLTRLGRRVGVPPQLPHRGHLRCVAVGLVGAVLGLGS